MKDTIAAIATALGPGAISIIRVSGEEAIDIVNKIFKGKDLSKVNSHSINYGYIIDQNKKIDEVLVSIMLKPKTFTMENVVEINCHGGIATTNKVLELLIYNGCRLAEPGEFTKRAFLNGRIDLIEAEAVMDLINSKTEKAREIAINQLNGQTSNLIKRLRQILLEILANIAVNIDYPEYEDIEVITIEDLKPKIKQIKEEIDKILKESKEGKIIKEGITATIIGKPNVGKSSLLNCLLEEEKAIVTDIAGTTRDIVEGSINIGGVVLNFIDTAGIRKTKNKIEQIGVAKSLELINKADLVIYVLDNSKKLTEEDKILIEKIKNKNYIIVINKIDLKSNLKLNDENIIKISTINKSGIDQIKKKIIELFNLEKIDTQDLTYLTNSKNIAILRQCLEIVNKIEESISENTLIDMIEIDIKEVWTLLGEIIGENYKDELIDQLFSQFCLGK